MLVVSGFAFECGDFLFVALSDGLEAYVVVVLLAGIEVLLVAHDEGEASFEGGPSVHLFLVEHDEALAEGLFLEGQFFSCSEVLKLDGEGAVCPTDGRAFGVCHREAHIAHRLLRLGLIIIQIGDALLGVGFGKEQGGGEQRDAKGECFLHYMLGFRDRVYKIRFSVYKSTHLFILLQEKG